MHLLCTAALCALFLNCVTARSDLLARLPSCAAACYDATSTSSICPSDDLGCQCADITFQTEMAKCNLANCTVNDSLGATNETYAACGIPIRDESRTMIAVTASIGALAVVMVMLRLADRTLSSQATLGWDDLLIGLSGNVPVIVAGRLGFGRDMWGISPYGITNSLKWLYVTYFMYQVAEFLCQLSILAFYLRIAASPKLRIATYTLMAIVTCFGLGNTGAMMFQCKPISYFWNGWRGETEGQCTVDVRLFGFIRGAIEITLDIAILSLPLPMLARLQITWKKKLRIMSMFCVGFVIFVVSCLRLWSLVRFDQSSNPTYDNVSGVYWCVTEANLFIVVACMPAMHGIYQHVKRTVQGKSSSGGSSSYGYSGGSGRVRKVSNRMSLGGISKSLEVRVQREDRSESDVELVERPPNQQKPRLRE